MPNFKIIQDVASQAKVQIYGSQEVPLNTDGAGNLSITPPASGLAITSTGLAITPPASGLTVTAAAEGLSITPPASGLAITSTGLAITPPASGLTVTAAAEGLSITPPASGLLITSSGLAVISAPAITDVSYSVSTSSIAGFPDNTFTVLGLDDWTFGIVNASTEPNAQTTVQLQISPSGEPEEWINEGAVVTLNQGTLGNVGALVAGTLLKYARVYYAAVNAASTVTLNIYFQGQTS
jgi:hypothetical protein